MLRTSYKSKSLKGFDGASSGSERVNRARINRFDLLQRRHVEYYADDLVLSCVYGPTSSVNSDIGIHQPVRNCRLAADANDNPAFGYLDDKLEATIIWR